MATSPANKSVHHEATQVHVIDNQAPIPVVTQVPIAATVAVLPSRLTGENEIYNLSDKEIVLFSYQWTVKILALIDIFFTAL